ncbi:tRNA A64-2'-O-ribosylphosphate transferase [Limtongia smithiae]|uniref:tRNA A64-2'-O-ribosylphosphate transferase n=1 Tax=Limtongia smithiae TaxID=1125753 RepID=UPI0034CDEECC
MNYAADPAIADTSLFSALSKSLRKDSRSIHNRLNSIAQDSQFVCEVAQSYDLPLVANERCGLWYIPPERLADSVYFKSTDGHTSQWGFSLRRLNLHILDLVVSSGGIIIVDSTRRGKIMPDALSKTIPIWCAVINRAVFGEAPTTVFATSRAAVPESEHVQIESRLAGWTEAFCNSGIDIDKLKSLLQKPLRPVWITPNDTHWLPHTPLQYPNFFPIVLCTASKMVLDGVERGSGYSYVQGAADDHEEWSLSITPGLFWANKEVLVHASDAEIEEMLERGVLFDVSSSKKKESGSLEVAQIGDTGIHIGNSLNATIPLADIAAYGIIVNLSAAHVSTNTSQYLKGYMHMPLAAGKKGSREFRVELPAILLFIKTEGVSKKTLFLCDTGSDFAVGAALAMLSLYFDENANLSTEDGVRVDKDLIRRRLIFIISKLKVNPSRATLQAVNAVLIK